MSIPKGTRDVTPALSYKWRYLENAAREVCENFCYKEIRTPTFEYTELFLRGVGETSDVVNKEMYTFEDKGGRSLTLKPEGTAGAVRLFIENGLSSLQMPVKCYYITPAFRYERPQAGRLRELHQFGVEIFGSASPETDAEAILAASSFLNKIGVKGVRAELNSIGCKNCRREYNAALKQYFAPHIDKMCPDCQTRFVKNPLRLLDCKEEECKKISAGAPVILDYLCPDCRAHFEKVKELLDGEGFEYVVNPRIVRGLDYYTRTVFEFVSGAIGAQGAVCAGGRYDGLVEELGGPSTPAVGFAAGLDRLLLLMESTGVPFPEDKKPDLYIAGLDEEGKKLAFSLAAKLRSAGVSCEIDHIGRSVKAQFKYADKSGAKYTLAIGETERAAIAEGKPLTIKKMADGSTAAVKIEDIYSYLKKGE